MSEADKTAKVLGADYTAGVAHACRCPLLGVKRTSIPHRKMSANEKCMLTNGNPTGVLR